MTGWEIFGAFVVGLMVLGFVVWVGWEDPAALAALAGSFVVSCVFVAAVALAVGAWSP